MTVDFRRPDMPDNYSDVSSVYNYNYHQPPNRRGSSYYADDDAGSLVRSLSQPSLARSASEFTENWGVRIRSYEDGDDLSSPDHTPRSSFRGGAWPRLQQQQQQHQHQHQQQYSAEWSTSTSTGTGNRQQAVTGTHRMFGGRTVSAAEWFHDADEHDDIRTAPNTTVYK